ncbi:FAD:protein FMN transferase [Paenibacillus wenxiniae]|uniref:FAD:protein FMN transferase n=1 Tax=Paenibacillus wenxiniae TaxID=1636843 RepID=A0ABW4RNY0_9BACL
MHRFQAMNSSFHTAGLRAGHEVEAESWFAFVERHLSRFKRDSELSHLNAQAGYPFYASALMYQAAREALHFYEQTDGLFNPFMGQRLCQLGYDRIMDWERSSGHQSTLQMIADPQQQEQKQQKTQNVQKAPSAISLISTGTFGKRLYTLDPILQTIHLHPDVQLDLGGIAKGWSAAQLAMMLQEQGESSGMIDAGGDLVIWGSQQREYHVEIADPWESHRTAATIELNQDAGIATSSTLRRSWQGSDQRSYHHLLDPRSGTSAQSEWVQMTVISPSLTLSEVYAKCVLILGADEGPGWLRRQCSDAAMIGIRNDGICVIDGPIAHYGQFYRQGEWITYEQHMA